ncbi:MAG: hypothetical protein J1F23_06915 [Oscillospiraceae bacterium]|nr:hypothetical protein [Oscillospiraceae bacterium]
MKNGTTKKKQPNYPCRGCVYFKACGENTRTMPCDGRQTKTEAKTMKRGK